MRRFLPLALIVTLLAATNLFAIGEARMTGKVLDADTKQPIADVIITADATGERTVHQDFKVKKDGTYAVFLLHGTMKYKFTVKAPGYQPYMEEMKLKLGEPNVKDFFLSKPGAAPVASTGTETKGDPAVDAYNEGAALANTGDYAGAIKKFEEAVAAKPDLLAGWMALAKVGLKAKEYPKAINAANKVLEIDDSDADMWGVLYGAYTATGDKAKAAEAEAKMPKNAGALFNQAARLINQQKDGEAETLLKQAIELDDSMAVAYYELGMLYVRAGKSADAKTALMKYLELDPNGRDAATAKEMLNYLK